MFWARQTPENNQEIGCLKSRLVCKSEESDRIKQNWSKITWE